jgi:hypothetical protein
MTERQYSYLFKQLSSHGWRVNEPIALQVEKLRALRQMAEIAYGKGSSNINYQRLAHDVDMHPLFVKRIVGVYATREEYSINTIKKRDEVERLFQSGSKEPG